VLNKIESYLLGFIQTDGHFNKKGEYRDITIELSHKDIDILNKINDYFNGGCSIYTRTRDTNFVKNYTSSTLRIKDKPFISKIEPFVPYGKKSLLIRAPENIEYSKPDYWRGIIDGDGSLGTRYDGIETFVALVTSSEWLFNDLCSFVMERFNWTITGSRNKRDGIYNIAFANYKAFAMASLLYGDGGISIVRKSISANDVINFDYQNISKSKLKTFTEQEDKIILEYPHKEALVRFRELYKTVELPSWFANTVACRRRLLKTLAQYGLLRSQRIAIV
jgi:hypothetical protein